ncbi:MAG: RIP metalloprotease RseP [Acidobacteriota bacterium]|nr:RIP metalloprotease RseP [Acidobacteriota bacterium]
MHDFLVSTVAFVVLIGVMVVVHEFGHFAVAKLCGVRVEAFSFGFGPRLFGIKYGDTDYKVCLLPLGGFVKMTGENPGEESQANAGAAARNGSSPGDRDGLPAYYPANDPGAFTSHPRWQRMLIGVAGPAANFILALALMIFYFGWINEVPSVQMKTTTVDWVVPGSAAARAGLEPGDVIRRFDSEDNPSWMDVYARAKLNASQNVAVTVERGSQALHLTLHVPADAKADDFGLDEAGLLPQYLPGPIQVKDVQPDTPAEKAGLRPGDAIQSVDGHDFHSVSSLVAYMQAGQGKPLSLVVLRNGAQLTIVAHPAKLNSDWKLGFASILPPVRQNPLSLKMAMAKSTGFCSDNSFLIVEFLQRIFEHKVSVSQMTGPVGIARMAGDAAEMHGWYPKFYLASVISLNLGILNLLPFPIPDGGLILLLLVESVIRHDINSAVKERIYQAAFVVLVAFFAFIIFNDVAKLPIFTHGKP